LNLLTAETPREATSYGDA